MALDELPEVRRPASIIIVVTVVEGPNSISRRLQYIASNQVETEAEQDIQIVTPDGGYGVC
jgi:pyrimidine operon attenuation protein/uracil phosphoribosyltransferase